MEADSAPGNGVCRFNLYGPAVAAVTGGAAFWNREATENMYMKEGTFSRFLKAGDLFESLSDYTRTVLGLPPRATVMETIVAMWACMKHERGVPVAGGTNRIFAKPPCYVFFAERLAALRTRPDWVEPPRWTDGSPSPACWAIMAKYPLACDDMGDAEPGTIQGSAWYAVVIMQLHPQCYLANTLGVNTIAICYEQFVRKDRGMFVAWPFDVLDARVTTGQGTPQTFEPWVPYEAQMDIYDHLEGDYEAEDFGDDDGGDWGHEGPYDDAASSADTSVGRPARWPVAPAVPPPAAFDPWQDHW